MTTSALNVSGNDVTMQNWKCWRLSVPYQLISHSPRGEEHQEYCRWQQPPRPKKLHLALFLFSPHRVGWIINLYINFPADRKRHVDMSSVSHGDWSWMRWDGRGRKPHSLADAAIPVNSPILFTVAGSERVSFPEFGSYRSLAQEQNWWSEVTRCCLRGTAWQQTFWQLEQLTGSLWWTEVTLGLLFWLTARKITIFIEKYCDTLKDDVFVE